MASEPNEWHADEDEREILHAPDGTATYWWKQLPKINALEARATRAEERLQIAVDLIKDLHEWGWVMSLRGRGPKTSALEARIEAFAELDGPTEA